MAVSPSELKFIATYNGHLKTLVERKVTKCYETAIVIWMQRHGEPARKLIEENNPEAAKLFYKPFEGV